MKSSMDIEEFSRNFSPRARGSRLDPFKKEILLLKERGYADWQIRDWLASNGLQVTRQAVQQFSRMAKEAHAMSANPNDTLDEALALLGYREDAPTHHKKKLLTAIHEHAAETKNQGLAYACEARLNLIKAETESIAWDSSMPSQQEVLDAFDSLGGSAAQPMALAKKLESLGFSASDVAIAINSALAAGVLVQVESGSIKKR